jgi:hypothetical protein
VGQSSIFVELDGFGRTLVDTGPALNTFLGMDRIRFVLLEFVNLTRADLNAVSTACTLFLVNHRIHCLPKKSETRISKLETNPRFKNFLFRTFEFWTFVLVSDFVLRI